MSESVMATRSHSVQHIILLIRYATRKRRKKARWTEKCRQEFERKEVESQGESPFALNGDELAHLEDLPP